MKRLGLFLACFLQAPAALAYTPEFDGIVLPYTTGATGVPGGLGITINGAEVAPWNRLGHQNLGGSCQGHQLCWGDQFLQAYADHGGIKTYDESVVSTVQFGSAVGTAVNSTDQFGLSYVIDSVTYNHSFTVSSVPGGGISTTTDVAKVWAAYFHGGAVHAAVASAGTGYTDGNTVTANMGTPGQAGYVFCPYVPQFRLTVVSGVVTAAARLPVQGAKVEGGACTAAHSNPLAVTGGSGAGLTLNVDWGWTDLEAATVNHLDVQGQWHTFTGFYLASRAGINADFVQFDIPGTAQMLPCPGASGFCGGVGQTIIPQFTTINLDVGPYWLLSRVATLRDPMIGDNLGQLRFQGQSSASSDNDTFYGQITEAVGGVATPVTTTGLAAQTCTIGSPCILTTAGFAGAISGLPTGATGGTNYLIKDAKYDSVTMGGMYISNVAANINGIDTDLSIVGTIRAPGITAGDLMSVVDQSNPVGAMRLGASTGSSGKQQQNQLLVGGYNGGVWCDGVGNSNHHGDGSQGHGSLNCQEYYVNGKLFLDGNYHYTSDAPATPTVASGSSDCGTSPPSPAGNDNAFRVTVGSGSNGGQCTVTFAKSWTNLPVCHATNETSAVLARAIGLSTTQMRIAGTLTAGDVLSVSCRGYE